MHHRLIDGSIIIVPSRIKFLVFSAAGQGQDNENNYKLREAVLSDQYEEGKRKVQQEKRKVLEEKL